MKTSIVGAVSAAFALCAVAGAQTSSAPIGASVRLGLFLPVNDTTIDATENGIFSFGADYRLAYKPPTFGAFTSGTSLSIDYFQKNDYGSTPVLLNYLAIKDRWTLFGGVGVGFTSTPGKNDTKFAYQVGLSYDLVTDSAVPVFIEGKFMGSEQSKLNGVGLFVGIRF